MNPRFIVFDCDGTLVNSLRNIVAAMERAFILNDLPAPEAHALRRTIGLSLDGAMAVLYPAGSAEKRRGLVEDYHRAAREQRALGIESPLYDGAAEAVAALDAVGYDLGIATGMSRRGLQAMLKTFDLAKHFVTLQTAADAPSKPHPAMVERAMADAGAEAEETVVIGDTSFDMEMARAAGVRAIGVSWGYHEAEALYGGGALTVVDGFASLPGIIGALK